MQKQFTWLLCLFLPVFQSVGQKAAIEESVDSVEAISHFTFLASDELKGRDAARMEIDIAARYIKEQFRKYGAESVDTLGDFYQYVPFRQSAPPKKGEVTFLDHTFTHGDDLLVLDGPDIDETLQMVYLGFGLEEDYEGKNVEGKVVVVKVGAPNRFAPTDMFASGREKMRLARNKGAAGVLELYNAPSTPWGLVVNFLNRPQMTLDENPDEEAALPYLWVKDTGGEWVKKIEGKELEVNLAVEGKVNRKIQGRNVVAYIPGTDPELSTTYVMLSAHYDHLGVGRPNAEGDSIYNGARDNAVGTVALINAAKYFAKNPPKRSILLCAWTAEEKGLLGSAYFSKNPMVSLKDIIYNLNIDNAGYNDTSVITVIGLGRTSVDTLIKEAVAEFGIEAIPDPAPEQGLYDRSDNVNFAREGIPAPTFSLGFTAFDEDVAKHYHQPSDRTDNFDMDYALLYWKAYLLSAEKIANEIDQPLWEPGDKYEEAAKSLYGLP
ncbi:M28 family peptidase [Pleomorphovibrio marinus]|uniref:M28 family peptidase n=1 Tax=Pleomorphovibrio marinus TaxID=2164132 RepID=UPI000E0B7EB5|nr:M28 family peptidase [Pleomorphovibrio marinus]